MPRCSRADVFDLDIGAKAARSRRRRRPEEYQKVKAERRRSPGEHQRSCRYLRAAIELTGCPATSIGAATFSAAVRPLGSTAAACCVSARPWTATITVAQDLHVQHRVGLDQRRYNIMTARSAWQAAQVADRRNDPRTRPRCTTGAREVAASTGRRYSNRKYHSSFTRTIICQISVQKQLDHRSATSFRDRDECLRKG